jgi:hypothetical protein
MQLSEHTGLQEKVYRNILNEIYVDSDDEAYHERFMSGELFKEFFEGLLH